MNPVGPKKIQGAVPLYMAFQNSTAPRSSEPRGCFRLQCQVLTVPPRYPGIPFRNIDFLLHLSCLFSVFLKQGFIIVWPSLPLNSRSPASTLTCRNTDTTTMPSLNFTYSLERIHIRNWEFGNISPQGAWCCGLPEVKTQWCSLATYLFGEQTETLMKS